MVDVLNQNELEGGGGRAGRRRFVLRPAEPVASVIEPDADQRAVVDHAGSVLVVGGPGTGKTTTAVEVAARRALGVHDGLRRVLVLCHGRSAAHDLRSRLVRRLGSTQTGTSVMTLHGFCLALQRRFGDAAGLGQAAGVRVLTAPEQDFRIRELLGGHDTSDWPSDLAQAASTRGLAGEVRAALARARQLTLDPQSLRELGQLTGRESWSAVGDFFDEYLDVLDAEGVIDYAELVHRARLLLLDETVRTALRAEHDLVVVDEFAECDTSQRRLVGDLAGLGLDVVAFADPSTRVFGFRGADPRGVVDFPDEVGVTGADGAQGRLPVLELRHDHRHPPEIAACLAGVAAKLPRADRVVDSVSTRRADARPRVQTLVFDSPGAESEHIAEILRSAHRDGLDWPQMAVICRTGRASLPALSRALTASGVPVEVAGDDVALADEQAVRPLVLGLELAAAIARGERAETDGVLRLLRSPIGGLDSLAIRRLARLLRAADAGVGERVVEWVDQFDADAGVVEPALARPSDELLAEFVCPPAESAPPVIEGDDAEAAAAVGELLRRVAGVIAAGATAHVALWQLWSGSAWPERLRSEALGGGDPSRRAHRDLDAVVALFDLAARDQSLTGDRGVRSLLTEVGGQAIPADTMRESNVRARGVRLLTAHRAKGQQWPLVVVAGVQEGTWPVLTRRGRLLDADELEPARLTEHGLLPSTPTGAVLADERRLFLLAASRASERLVVTASAGTEGEHDRPSRFLRELGVGLTPVSGRPQHATTLQGLAAELRRVLLDPQSPPALREAASVRLARLADAHDRHRRPLVRAADPAAWWGIGEPTASAQPIAVPGRPVELSGSSLEQILRCPRQWFLSRRARADSPRSSAQSFGSLLHVLVQHAASDGLELETLNDHLERVWADVVFDAKWLATTERAEADAALERYVAWADQFNSRTVLGTEVSFRQQVEVDGEPVMLSGTVDRLELDSAGRLRIIDFKTGRSVPTVAAATANDQMGVYQLAAASGAFDAHAPGVREVAGADLVYLRKNDGPTPFPKVFTQPSITDHPHPSTIPTLAAGDGASAAGSDGSSDGGAVEPRPTWVHDRVAVAAGIIRREEFSAVRNGNCQFCPFQIGCPTTTRELVP